MADIFDDDDPFLDNVDIDSLVEQAKSGLNSRRPVSSQLSPDQTNAHSNQPGTSARPGGLHGVNGHQPHQHQSRPAWQQQQHGVVPQQHQHQNSLMPQQPRPQAGRWPTAPGDRLPPRPGSGPPRQPATSWPGSQAAAGSVQPPLDQGAAGHVGPSMSQEAGRQANQPDGGRQANQNRGQSQQQQQGGWQAGQPAWSQQPQQQQQGAWPEQDVHARLQVLQQERDRLKAETSSLQGTMATLRMQLDGAAKQRDNLHRQLQQSAAPQNGLAAFSAQETARQLQALRQELAFKEQEVEEMQRRDSERNERLQEVQTSLAQRKAEVAHLQAANAQLEADGQGRLPPAPFGEGANVLRDSENIETAAGSSIARKLAGTKRRRDAEAAGSAAVASQASPAAAAPAPQAPTAPSMQRSIESASVQAGLSALSKPGSEAWEQPQWCGQQAVCSAGHLSSNSATLRHLWEACSADLALLLQADHPGSSSGPWRKAQSLQASLQLMAADIAHSSVGLLQGLVHYLHEALAQISAVGRQLQENHQRLQPVVSQTEAEQQLAAHGSLGRCCAGSAAALNVARGLLQRHEQCRQAALASSGVGRAAQVCAGGSIEHQHGHFRSERLQLQTANGALPPAAPTQSTGRAALGQWQPTLEVPRLPSDHSTSPGVLGLMLELLGGALQHSSWLEDSSRRSSKQSDSDIPSGSKGNLQGPAARAASLSTAAQQSLAACQALAGAAVAATAMLVACVPVPEQGHLSAVPASGAFQQLAANPNHELGFLSLLFQLIQSSAVCSRLLADCSPSAARLQKGAAMRSGTGQQAQQMGGSAASLDATEPPLGDTVNVDMADAEGADRGGSSWTTLMALLHGLQPPVLSPEHLLSTLQQQQVPAVLVEASGSSAQPDASAAAGWTPQQILAAAERQQASHWGLYERQRRALQILAMLWRQGQQELLLDLILGREPGSAPGLCQQVLAMVDAATRDPSGGIAAPFQTPAFPGNPAEALQQPTAALHCALQCCHVSSGNSRQAPPIGAAQTEAGSRPPRAGLRAALAHAASQPQGPVAVTLAELSAQQQARLRCMMWWQGLRLAQEGLTLLRVLLNSDHTGAAALEELTASSSALRLGLVTTARLMQWQTPASTAGGLALQPLPVAPWVTMIGSSRTFKCADASLGIRGQLACCSVEDVSHMAKRLRQRILMHLG